MDPALSLQDQFAAKSICFGCGPANKKGLQIKSFVHQDDNGKPIVIAKWHAQPYHEAFPGMLNGGIIGALLDCHSNWTACWHLMECDQMQTPPCTVTASFNVTLRRPTPSDHELTLEAKPVHRDGKTVTIEAKLFDEHQNLCATCEGIFVAVDANHPAYHRW